MSLFKSKTIFDWQACFDGYRLVANSRIHKPSLTGRIATKKAMQQHNAMNVHIYSICGDGSRQQNPRPVSHSRKANINSQPKQKCPENTEIVCKQENDKIPCDGKKMMDRAGAPNDCLDVKIVRTVLMKTWQISFDANFPNSVLPTRWKLQSLADSASTHSSKRWQQTAGFMKQVGQVAHSRSTSNY